MPLPDDYSFADIVRDWPRVLRVLRFEEQMRNIDVIQTGGKIKRIQISPKSLNAVLDLREKESTIPAIRAPRPPPTVSDLELWLKADTLLATLSDGDPVGTWTDSSTYGRNVTATGAARPTFRAGVAGTMPVVRFDGVDDVLTYATGKTFSACTIFVVIRQTGVATQQTVFAWGNASGSNTSLALSLHSVPDYGPLLLSVNANSNGFPIGGSFPLNSFHTFSFRFAGGSVNTLASYSYFDNGVPVTIALNSSVGALALSGIVVGGVPAANFLGGDIAELMVYSTALTTAEREEIEDYLMTKYAATTAAPIPNPVENPAATECEECLGQIVIADDEVACVDDELITSEG